MRGKGCFDGMSSGETFKNKLSSDHSKLQGARGLHYELLYLKERLALYKEWDRYFLHFPRVIMKAT